MHRYQVLIVFDNVEIEEGCASERREPQSSKARIAIAPLSAC
jgi:hypothetical protein